MANKNLLYIKEKESEGMGFCFTEYSIEFEDVHPREERELVEKFLCSELFCGEHATDFEFSPLEVFDGRLYRKTVEENLPEDKTHAWVMLLEIAKAYVNVEAIPPAKEIVKNISEYREKAEKLEEAMEEEKYALLHAKWNMEELFDKTRLSIKEYLSVSIQKQIDQEEFNIKSNSKKIEESRDKIVALKNQLEQYK